MSKILSIFESGEGTLSSKRIAGVLCILCAIYCAVSKTECSFVGEIITAGVVLLGADTVKNTITNIASKDETDA